MARQTIGVGSQANDGTGDTLRSAAIKMNNNFEELYSGYSSSTLVDATGTIDASFETILSVSESSISLTLPNLDASSSGKKVRVIASASGSVSLSGTIFGIATLNVSSGGVADLVWGVSSWYLINNGNTNLTIT